MFKNSKGTIIAIAAAIVLLGGLILIAKPPAVSRVEPQDNASHESDINSKEKTAPSPLVSDRNSHDFGRISMAAGRVKTAFKIKNSAAEAVTVSKVYTSCMCTTALFKYGGANFGPFGMMGHGFLPKIKQTLAPNEEAEVEVEFDPTAHGPAGVGRIDRTVYVENQSGAALKLRILAEVTP